MTTVSLRKHGFLNQTASANVINSGTVSHWQNFDLEKKEENSETDEDGLKAESPELVWQVLDWFAPALSLDDQAALAFMWREHFLGKKKKKKKKSETTGGSVSLCLIVSVSFVNVSLRMADVLFSQISVVTGVEPSPGGASRTGVVYHLHLLCGSNETCSITYFVRLWSFRPTKTDCEFHLCISRPEERTKQTKAASITLSLPH